MKKHLVSVLVLLCSACAFGSSDPSGIGGSEGSGGSYYHSDLVACTQTGETCASATECCQNKGAMECITVMDGTPPSCMLICVQDADCCTGGNTSCGICRPILGHDYGVCD